MAEPTPSDFTRILSVPPIPFRDQGFPVSAMPSALTSFVGRERDVAAVVDLLRDQSVRLVTLTGPGGVGKTRLALRGAAEVTDAYADGVVFVPLGAVADSTLVVPSIAHVLGIRETGDRSLMARMMNALRDRQPLIVLDNVEHVTEAAPYVVQLLAGCPNLKMLATGRAPLRSSGEHVLSIAPLELPNADLTAVESLCGFESVRLFVDRAAAARHDFVLTDGNAAEVVAIVRRLDGLPLAIELAAARIAHLTPAALLARLERTVPLLTGGARDLPARQRTMAATLAWSHALLESDEQILFQRLSVFVGGWTLEAAEAVVGAVGGSGETVLDGIAALVEKSLVYSTEGAVGLPRYAMLETIRAFGLDQLVASGEAQAVRRAHASWCVALAEQADPGVWGGPDHRRWLDLLQSDLANFRAALAWLEEMGDNTDFLRLAAALSGLWHHRSYRLEGRAWLARALEVGGDAPLARATALIKLVTLDPSVEGPRAIELMSEAVALRREHGDRFSLGRALLGLSYQLGESSGRPLIEEAAELMESVDDHTGLAFIRHRLAVLALERNDADRARALISEAMALFEKDGFDLGIAQALLLLGRIDVAEGDLAGAAGRYTESLHLFRAVGSHEGQIDALVATADLVVKSGRAGAATQLLAAGMARAETLGYTEISSTATGAMTAARESLGTDTFAKDWAIGWALTLDQASDLASALLSAIARPPENAADRVAAPGLLTPRERQVLVLIAEGLSDREVSATLFIGPSTVRSHLTSVFSKLDVGSRTAAVASARQLGIL